MRFTRHRAAVMLLAVLPVTSAIAETKQTFNIPKQSLSSALLQFSESTGIKTFFKADLARNRTTQGVSGNFTQAQALDTLLADTGVDYRFTDTKSVTLVAETGNAVPVATPQPGPERIL